jgi:hypothetical protein
MTPVNEIGLFIATWVLFGAFTMLIDVYILGTIYASTIRNVLCVALWPIVLLIRIITLLRFIAPEK